MDRRYSAEIVKYDWKDAGEEWSEPWGNSEAQWKHTIRPRLADWLPAHTILEIGAGFGRWTRYLKDECERLLVLDKKEECIAACHQRFGENPKLDYFVNDGRSLDVFPDNSLDFVFSFDSLVHPDRDVIESYLRELAKKLKSGGKGFFHHSNLAAYEGSFSSRLPEPIQKLLRKLGLLDWTFNRNPTMSAALFRTLCARHGLTCVKQELINWRGKRLIDCFSWFERSAVNQQAATEIVRNPDFMKEAERIRLQTRATS